MRYSDTDVGEGIRPKPETAVETNSNFHVLTCIQAKAFRYALWGDEIYGLEALLAIKNYINTLVLPYEADPNYCRSYGMVIYITACVYDWCYDLMTPADRAHLIAGIETKIAPHMEVGFPPIGQSSVTGHGSEAQILRDWFSFAIATYDEAPDLYEYIGGRLFQHFLPGQSYYLTSGSHHQGKDYGAYRYKFLLLPRS